MFYMEDITLFVRHDENLIGLLTNVKEFRNDTGVDFIFNKSTFVKGKLNQTISMKLCIKELNL